jgi:ABC-type transport system involved in multi-copper enzyme maturation permease subunit
MLWYKSWMETRWVFLIGLLVASCVAASVVLVWPKVMGLLPLAATIDPNGKLGQEIRESAAQVADYRSYIVSQWFAKNLRQIASLFGILLGSGGLLSQAAGGAALFTLSMPVSRKKLLATRATAGLAELGVLTVGASLMIPLFSPSVGKSYGADETLLNSMALWIAASVFFSLTFFLSTVFTDIWRPLLIALGVAIGVSIVRPFLHIAPGYMVFDATSSGSAYAGDLPWRGLLVRVALSAALLYGAVINIQRRDF